METEQARSLEEITELKKLVATWIEIGYPDRPPTPADAEHSALLERLLAGKEPLEHAPPRSFSQPWYELCDQGVDEGHFEVHFQEYATGQAAIINQAPWLVEAELEPDQIWLVSWIESGMIARLSRLDRESSPAERWRLEVVQFPDGSRA